MKKIIALCLLTILACSPKKAEKTVDQRFAESMIPAERTGTLKRLTSDGRSIYPIFAPGDTIILYERLLLTSAADTIAYFPEDMSKPYGINILDSTIYTLEGTPSFPSAGVIDTAALPHRYHEETVWGVASPDSTVYAFETIAAGDSDEIHLLYLAEGDSVRQLSYGRTSCFLDRFSNTGRYLTAIYGTGPTWILIFDLEKDLLYRTQHEGDSIDYLTNFSPNDDMMLFIRSEKKYKRGGDYFGDIWLLRFDK